MTIQELIDMMSKYPKDSTVISFDGKDYIHIVNTFDDRVILSTEKPKRWCDRCGDYVYEEFSVTDYPYYCPTCDENMYEFETSEIVKEDS